MAKRTDTRSNLAVAGRRLVQVSFLLLFLLPLGVTIYRKATFETAPVFTSWLLAWDPILLASQAAHRFVAVVVVGAPLLLLALSLVFGRFFCGWVCPLGTILDGVRWLAFWRRRKENNANASIFPPDRNSRLRYTLLALVLAASLVSMKFLGLLDPLVIFTRVSSSLANNIFSVQQPGTRATISLVSVIFIGILALELWQPRFWCRNLCPLGALISLISRFSLLRRVVPAGCSNCNACGRSCPMNAVRQRGTITDYSDCTFCLECTPACPTDGITFSLYTQDGGIGQPVNLDRRAFLGTAAVSAVGLALLPLAELAPAQKVLRPPGALPEKEFIQTCIICQECIRACPTGALRPALLESGLAGIGTPVLVPRQGGCALNPSCPDLCAAACPVGAIRPVTKDKMKIGLAVVHREACLAWDQGTKCLVCVEACLNSAAIAFDGRVTVDPAKCTGCGRCESGCPVPGGAIRVEPVERGSVL